MAHSRQHTHRSDSLRKRLSKRARNKTQRQHLQHTKLRNPRTL